MKKAATGPPGPTAPKAPRRRNRCHRRRRQSRCATGATGKEGPAGAVGHVRHRDRDRHRLGNDHQPDLREPRDAGAGSHALLPASGNALVTLTSFVLAPTGGEAYMGSPPRAPVPVTPAEAKALGRTQGTSSSTGAIQASAAYELTGLTAGSTNSAPATRQWEGPARSRTAASSSRRCRSAAGMVALAGREARPPSLRSAGGGDPSALASRGASHRHATQASRKVVAANSKRQSAGVVALADVVPVEEVLAEPGLPPCLRRSHGGLREALGCRVRVDVEGRPFIAAVARATTRRPPPLRPSRCA